MNLQRVARAIRFNCPARYPVASTHSCNDGAHRFLSRLIDDLKALRSEWRYGDGDQRAAVSDLCPSEAGL